MIVPRELPDNSELRAVLQRYVAINDHADDLPLSMILFSLRTLLLTPMCFVEVDGERQAAFAHIADRPGVKALHMYTDLSEVPPLADDVCMVPYALRKMMDEVLWKEKFTAVVIDPSAAHSVLVQLLPDHTFRLLKTRVLLGESN